MTPSRLVRAVFVFVLFLTASFAAAATTEFRVFFDTDRNAGTGCTVGGMNGVEQILVTQVTDSGGTARVTRTFRQLCTGSALGPILDEDTSGWNAVLQTGSGELTFETRMRLSSFGPDGITRDMRLGFEANRPPATHTALVDDDGSDVVLFGSSPRRRASRSVGAARAIVLDGNLGDWSGLVSIIHGMASGGTRDLRLLRVFAWADPAEPPSEKFLYFAVVARLASDAPFADDDVYSRQDGQSLTVAGPGVLANDGDPLGQDLDAEIVTQPTRGSVVLNTEEGGFTYSPNHPQSKATDTFEYKVRAGTRESNVARVKIKVRDGEGNQLPSFTPGGNVTVDETSGLYQALWATQISPGLGETQTVAFTVTNDNNGLFSMQPVIAPNGTLRFVPMHNRNGSAVVTVTLTDSEGASTTPVTFTIFVRNANNAPEFTLGPNQIVTEDAGPQTVSRWVTGIEPGPADESEQSVAFTITRNTNPSLFSAGPAISPDGVLTYTPAPNANGVATITVRGTDDGSPAASEERQFTITVRPVNDPPSFTASAATIVVVDTAGPQTVPGWATSILAGPANESRQALDFIVSTDSPELFSVAPAVAPNGTLTFTPAPGRDGAATVTVQLHDNGGTANGGVDTSASHAFVITIERAPSITSASSTTLTVGQHGTFTVTATGRPTPTIAHTGGTLPAGVTFVDGTLSGTPAAGTGGTYALTFQATNARGTSAVQNFTLIVNQPPAITSANSATFTRGLFGSFTVTTTGHPTPSIALSGPALPAGLTFTDHGNGTATLSGKPTVAVASYGGFTLTASNGSGANATQNFTINIGSVVYPMPGSTSEAPVICIGCPGANSFGQANNGLATYPYASPLVAHVGRYVDSQTTPNFQHVGFRTARARTMRTYPQQNGQAPPRVYIQIGNAVGAYALDTFFTTKLPPGPVSATAVGALTGSPVSRFGAPVEKLVLWDGFLYPEARSSGWFAPLIDQQDPMGKGGPFDVDDRGYIYAGFPTFGWGIATDDGRTNSTHFAKVVQMIDGGDQLDQTLYPNTRDDNSGVPPESILVVPSGGKYYAIIAGLISSSAVFDVTTPSAPVHLTTYPGANRAMRRWDRSDVFQRVAYIDGARNLQVYSYTSIVSGGAPIVTELKTGTGFTDVAIDESGTIWAIENDRVVKLTPSGGGYVATSFTPFGANFTRMTALAVGAGHLAVIGEDRNATIPAFDVRLANIETGAPVEVPLGSFFRNYYHGALPGYAEPGQYTLPADLQLIEWNGKTYFMYSANGLGDVFEIAP